MCGQRKIEDNKFRHNMTIYKMEIDYCMPATVASYVFSDQRTYPPRSGLLTC